MLVIDALKKATTKEQKIALTNQLEDILTSHRQNMFSRFEQQVQKISAGRLSGNELSDIYAKESLCLVIQSKFLSHWEWSTIPRMLDVPFYVTV